MHTKSWSENLKARFHSRDGGDSTNMEFIKIGYGNVDLIRLTECRVQWRVLLNMAVKLRSA
jgi:hypothetical protein